PQTERSRGRPAHRRRRPHLPRPRGARSRPARPIPHPRCGGTAMTTSSAAWALQEAIFATLANDDGIKDVAGDPPRLFDAVPRGVAFPYIVIGDDHESDWSTAT